MTTAPQVIHKLLELEGATQLFAQSWTPPDEPARGTIGIVHGLGEHSGRYHELAAKFVNAGYGVLSYDQRGHGKNAGKRGDAPNYDVLLDDVEALVREMNRVSSTSPKFLFGQSFGGALVLNLALRRKPLVDGIIVSSPLLMPSNPPSFIKQLFGRMARYVWPSLLFRTGLDPAGISRDPEVVATYKSDPLIHDRVSARFAVAMLDAGVWALQNAQGLTIPTLLMHGDADPITSPTATAAFADNAPTDLVTFKTFPGCFHELHWELERDNVFDTVVDWIQSQSGSTSPEG